MMFLKDVIASRKMDGNIPRPNDVIDSGRSTKHSEEGIVTNHIISTNENQVQKKKGHHKFYDPSQTKQRRHFVRKGKNVMRLKDVIDTMMSGRREVGCVKNNFFPNLSVIVLILMCYSQNIKKLLTVSSESLQQLVCVCW
jgi:hypothetical protein